MSEKLVLRIALGKHEHVRAIRDGLVRSPKIAFEFVEMDPLPSAFKRMIRQADIDVSEMAVVTHLLACDFGKPITGLAIPLWSRLPHANLVCATGSDIAGPMDLQHRRSGVRSYAQTSGVWVRGILEEEYGIDLRQLDWLTMEEAHVAQYQDPSNCTRNTSQFGLRELLLKGELASIMGERVVDPGGIRTVIPNAEQAAKEWIKKRGIYPINHIVSIRKQLLVDHTWLARELTELFEAARAFAPAEGAAASPHYGLEPNRDSLQLALDYSFRQGVVPRPYIVDEIFCAPLSS